MDDDDGFPTMCATTESDPMSLRREPCAGLNLSRRDYNFRCRTLTSLRTAFNRLQATDLQGSASSIPLPRATVHQCSTPYKAQRGNVERAGFIRPTPPEASPDAFWAQLEMCLG